jgi:uncharacterized protein (TIGR03083 family)
MPRHAMPLTPLPVTDTRGFFRPLGRELVALLGDLPAEGWDRPTSAGVWLVRDVVAHLSDTALRRLSLHRDGTARGVSPASEGEVAALVGGLNASWVSVARRFSGRALTAIYRTAIEELADFFETLPLGSPALFPVSWAGEATSAGWFDVAREFTEQWHHQAQVRDAVEAPPPSDPAWLAAVLETSLRCLPHAYRTVSAPKGASCVVEISGPSGGVWTLRREADAWTLWRGEEDDPRTEDAGTADGRSRGRIALPSDAAWRLFFHARTPESAASAIRTSGNPGLAAAFLAARSVILGPPVSGRRDPGSAPSP